MKTTALICLAALSAVVAASQATDPAAMAQKFGASAKANAAALRPYTWQMRVAITLKGEPKPPKLYAMRYDVDGKLEKTELTAPAAPAPPERGLKDRVKEKKIAEAKEWAGEVADLVKSYLTPSPAVLQTFFSKSTAVDAPGGVLQIYATDVIAPGDKMVYEITPDTQKLTRVMFNTALDGDPLDGQVEFATIPGGPNYAARTTVNVPKKQLTAIVENFQYVKQ
jgi:hypothetical protein